MSKKLIGGLIAICVLATGVTAFAQRYSLDDPDGTYCDDQIAEYQAAVKSCLDAAITLADAKNCYEAEP